MLTTHGNNFLNISDMSTFTSTDIIQACSGIGDGSQEAFLGCVTEQLLVQDAKDRQYSTTIFLIYSAALVFYMQAGKFPSNRNGKMPSTLLVFQDKIFGIWHWLNLSCCRLMSFFHFATRRICNALCWICSKKECSKYNVEEFIRCSK